MFVGHGVFWGESLFSFFFLATAFMWLICPNPLDLEELFFFQAFCVSGFGVSYRISFMRVSYLRDGFP